MSEENNKSKTQLLGEIHRVLVGEPHYKREGLIETVQRHDAWINNAKVRIAGILGASGVLAVGLNKAWEFFTNKH